MPKPTDEQVRDAMRAVVELRAWAADVQRELDAVRQTYQARQRVSPEARRDIQPAVDVADTVASAVDSVAGRASAAADVLARAMPDDPMTALLRSCQGKRRYHSAEYAGSAATARRRAGCRDALRVYDCPVCRGFHLTKVSLEKIAARA